MTEAQSIEQLKSEWQAAKKASDSLSANFRDIEAARNRAAEARKRYVAALQPAPPA